MHVDQWRSVNPHRTWAYVLVVDGALEHLQAQIERSQSTSDALEWKAVPESSNGHSTAFWVWRTDYRGYDPLRSVAKCIAQETDGSTLIRITVRVSGFELLLKWFLWGGFYFLIVVYLYQYIGIVGLTIAAVAIVGLAWKDMRQSRDDPTELIQMIAGSLGAEVIESR